MNNMFRPRRGTITLEVVKRPQLGRLGLIRSDAGTYDSPPYVPSPTPVVYPAPLPPPPSPVLVTPPPDPAPIIPTPTTVPTTPTPSPVNTAPSDPVYAPPAKDTPVYVPTSTTPPFTQQPPASALDAVKVMMSAENSMTFPTNTGIIPTSRGDTMVASAPPSITDQVKALAAKVPPFAAVGAVIAIGVGVWLVRQPKRGSLSGAGKKRRRSKRR
jgi:hypothetical protein